MKVSRRTLSPTGWLIRFLVQSYFIKLNSILIVYDSKSSSNIQLEYLKGLTTALESNAHDKIYVVQWIDAANLSKNDFNEIILKNTEIGCQGYISLISNTSKFISGKYYATERSIQRLKDIIFLFLSVEEDPKEVLSHTNLNLYPNHLLVNTNENDKALQLWTQKFTGFENHDEVILLNTLFANFSFAKSIRLYPDKLQNLNEKILKAAALTYLPYTIADIVDDGFGNVDLLGSEKSIKNVFYDGTEAQIVIEFCKMKNLTLQIMPYGKDAWGGIHENYSSDGMIGSVYRKETEFGIGCYYNWYNEIFETSFTIAKSAVTLLAPAPSLYPPFLTAILPFTPLVWLLIIISIILGSLTLEGIQLFTNHVIKKKKIDKFRYCETCVRSFLEIAAIFFQQSFLNARLNKFSTRFFLATILFAGVTLENAYSGNLKSLLTVPLYTDPIDTTYKFADSNLKWGAPAPAWVLSISESNIPYEQKLNQNFEMRSYDDFRNFSFSKRYGLGVERLHSGSYSFGSYIQQDAIIYLILLKDDIFFEYTRGFSIRGWPLMNDFNTFILWTLEHGLFHIWERRMVARYLDCKTEQALLILASGHKEKPLPVKLNVYHVSGPLCILIIGYTIALIVFLIEILIHKFGKSTTTIRIVTPP